MANFEQAIKWLREGKKIKRPEWKEGSYWTLGIDETVMWNKDIIAHIHLNQIEAKDWEIYEESHSLLHSRLKNQLRIHWNWLKEESWEEAFKFIEAYIK
jgi:hypothetical protein